MLFDAAQASGFFVGLEEGNLAFGAEITLNYDIDYQSRPMIGAYVIIELERPEEAVLGRITAISSHGRLASTDGEDLGARAVDQKRPIPEDIKQQFLRYRCSIRLLGLLREDAAGKILFTPSHRRLPHMGAKVAFASGPVLESAAGARRPGKPIGFLAFGEFVYAQGHSYAANFPPNFQIIAPAVQPNFEAQDMVARRTAVLARSGYGKSNLLKILFARLYENGTPSTPNWVGQQVPVGTLIFDPDGDYFWPGRSHSSPPGLCDVPGLVDQIVLATDRHHQDPYYESFRVTSSRLDLRTLPPKLVASIGISELRQGQRGSEAIYRMSQTDWRQLVDASWHENHGSHGLLSIPLIRQLCHLTDARTADTIASGIRNTMLDMVEKLHDPTSVLVPTVMRALRDGKLMIVDLSLIRGQPATIVTGILLRYIFEHSVKEHTKAQGQPLPVIALIEEAQTVLDTGNISNAPFVDWVKEGRKYDLGAVLVTQQPGAIDQEILSQTDNFFVFHLISGKDLNALKSANGHFSDDILASLLNEPIEGQGVFWSSAGEKTTYPIPFRAYNFGDLYQRLPSAIVSVAPTNYASKVKASAGKADSVTPVANLQLPASAGLHFPNDADLPNTARQAAKELESDLAEDLKRDYFALFRVTNWFKNKKRRKQGADKAAIEAITALFGLYGYGWRLENKVSQAGNTYAAVVKMDPEDGLKRLEAGEEPLVEGNSTSEAGAPTSTDDDDALFESDE